jgi:tRNA-specific 2-thiouridylase
MSKIKNKKGLRKKALIAISGGVDSSAAALLLQKNNYELIGVYMKLGVDQGDSESAARQVCRKLGIKFYPYNVAPKFKKEVINYFLDSYAGGITPNPCVNCNRFIKFGELLKFAEDLGCDYLATGHYVKKQESKKARKQIKYKLLKARDTNKDQSYFLYNLTQGQLSKILFPLGDYTKVEIKKIAAEAGLPNQKNESQDICFLPGDHNDFLKKKLKLESGKIVLREKEQERVIGQHQGLPLYTLGQRKGIDIGGSGPFYVSGFNNKKNILYVTDSHDDPLLYRNQFAIKQLNWISGCRPKLPFKCEAVIRYRHQPVSCIIMGSDDNFIVELDKPERAITPGQSAVFYKKNEVIGGGIVSNFSD